MKEQWKDIKNYEGLYQVSNLGRIKCCQKKVWNRYKFIVKKEKIKKVFDDGNGYFKVVLCKNSISKSYRVSRLVAEHFIPNLKNKPQVNHINRDTKNNNVYNLEWCTRSENLIHSVKNFGSYAKLTPEQVREIRKLYPESSYKELAKIYNVTWSAISCIIRRKTWEWLV